MNTAKPIPQFYGEVKDFRFHLEDRESYDKYIRSLEGKRVSAVFRAYKRRNNRSLNQNAYYWGVVVALLAIEIGYQEHEHEELHEALKLKFLRKKPEGKKLEFTPSTSSLNTLEFEDYLGKIRSWASMTLGCYIPLPNETEFDYE